MLLTKQDDKFIALTRYEEKEVPKGAGFRWDAVEQHWFTKDPMIAAKLYGFADHNCRSELEALSKQYDQTIKASKARDANIKVPAPTGRIYRPFQLAGIKYASEQKILYVASNEMVGTLIADDMGLGKTIQAIGLFNLITEINKALIICPNNIKIGWVNEFSDWKTKNTTIGIATPQLFPNTDVVVINYDLLKKYNKELRGREWHLIVVDECHFIKNPKAIRTQQIIGKKVKGHWDTTPLKAKWRLGLSGTPLLNRPIELFPILNWLDPKTFDNFFKFGIRYANGHKNGYGWDFSGYSNLKELQQKLRSTIMIRRTKSEVLTELPPKIRQVIEIPLESKDGTLASIVKEREAYEKCMEELMMLKEAVELAKISDNQDDYHAALLRLKDAQSIAFNEMAKVRHETALIKLPIMVSYLKEMMEEYGNKIVIFGHHHDMINGLAKEFPNCAILTGEYDIDEKDAAVTRFVDDPACGPFLGSIKAAGIGLNRLQFASSHCIFVEEDWVPAWITQCEDRLHRMGQLSSVLCQHYVLQSSIDSIMAKKVVQKQNISDKALDKGLEVGQALTLEEINPDLGLNAATTSVTPDQLTVESEKLSPKQVNDIHNALKIISMMCDGAKASDGVGFNKFDARLGKNLANQGRLTPKAAALGRKIVLKYQKQLSPEVIESFKEI